MEKIPGKIEPLKIICIVAISTSSHPCDGFCQPFIKSKDSKVDCQVWPMELQSQSLFDNELYHLVTKANSSITTQKVRSHQGMHLIHWQK